MLSSKEKISNTKAYTNAADDPLFRTRQSIHSKEDKYDPTKYSVHYNTLSDPVEDPTIIRPKEKVSQENQTRKQASQEKTAERQVKSSQSHVKIYAKESSQDTLSEGVGNRTIRENSELQMTVDFKDNKGLLSVMNIL